MRIPGYKIKAKICLTKNYSNIKREKPVFYLIRKQNLYLYSTGIAHRSAFSTLNQVCNFYSDFFQVLKYAFCIHLFASSYLLEQIQQFLNELLKPKMRKVTLLETWEREYRLDPPSSVSLI